MIGKKKVTIQFNSNSNSKQEKSNLKKIKIPKRKRWLGGSLNFIVGNSTMQYQDVTDKRKKKQGKVKQIVSIQVITCNVALKIIL